jgi:hypothetical protein
MAEGYAPHKGPDCCGSPMRELAAVGESQPVVVYRCDVCGRTDAVGYSADPHWVSAKGRAFLALRQKAYERAALEAPPAVAIFDASQRKVIFVGIPAA